MPRTLRNLDTMSQEDTAPGDALVIAAKYPEPGKVKTRLGAALVAVGCDDGFEQAALLYSSFLRDLSARFGKAEREDGYRLHWACAGIERRRVAMRAALRPADMRPALPAPRIFAQRGDGLGERLAAICLDMQAAGYRRVVILGSDSPQIPRERVQQAFAALDTHDVTLGPALDGGYYLVGVWLTAQKYATPPDIFRPVRMSAPTTLDETLACVNRLGLTSRLLPTDFDVDEPPDVFRLAEYLQAHGEDDSPQTAHRLANLLGVLRSQ